jgi:hypothetical protein
MEKVVKYTIIGFIIIVTFLMYVISIPRSKIRYDIKYQQKLFYNTDDKYFENLKLLEYNYKTILSEMPPFYIQSVTIKRNGAEWANNISSENFNLLKNSDTWVEGSNNERYIWYNYPLLVNNIIMCGADKKCPKTLKLLQLSGLKINVAGYALLLPKSKLSLHTDITGLSNNTVAVNIKLSGTDSYLYIKNKNNNFDEYEHQDGKAVIFNSQIEHYAINNGPKIRYILYMDIGLS